LKLITVRSVEVDSDELNAMVLFINGTAVSKTKTDEITIKDFLKIQIIKSAVFNAIKTGISKARKPAGQKSPGETRSAKKIGILSKHTRK